MRAPIEKQVRESLHKYFIQEYGREYLKAQKAGIGASWNIYTGPGYHRLSEKQYFAQLNRVREFRDSRIPSVLYVDLDCDYVSSSAPEGYEDEETGEYIEPYVENTYQLTKRDITKCLFGECASYL